MRSGGTPLLTRRRSLASRRRHAPSAPLQPGFDVANPLTYVDPRPPMSAMEQWWQEAERSTLDGGANVDTPIGRAFVALIDGRAREAPTSIEASGELRPIARFLERWRDSVHASPVELVRIDAELVDAANRADPATRPRILHFLASLRTRRGLPLESERLAAEALLALDPSATLRRAWVLDTLATAFHRTGAFHEARRFFGRALDEKRRSGDVIGVGITAGSWARMELELRHPARAVRIVEEALALPGLSALSRVRLATTALEAKLEAGEDPDATAKLLADAITTIDPAHHLVGYARIALARHAHHLGDGDTVHEHLTLAEPVLRLPFPRLFLHHWRRALGEAGDLTSWFDEAKSLAQAVGPVSEGEVLACCLAAVEAGVDGGGNAILDALEARVAPSNSDPWFAQLDAAGMKVDPVRAAQRRTRRFSGWSERELGASQRVDATLVFADLVDFTRRSTTLEPAAVMDVVRSLYELASPFLHRDGVQPLQHLGDGLLAAALGQDHGTRGLRFALDFTERMSRLSALHEVLAGHPLERDEKMLVRCGVATGPVVFGPLGSLFKTDYTAIGLATNRAARLQGYAEPEEVVCDVTLLTGDLEARVLERLSVVPKGFDKVGKVEAARLRAGWMPSSGAT